MHRLVHFSDRALVVQLQLRGFESRRIATSAGSVHVLDARGRGDLPPLVVLHGFSAAACFYDGVMTRMRPHAKRVVAPDLLGHGLSEMPRAGLDHEHIVSALMETLDAIIGEPAIVFGNSLGGAVGLRFASQRPEKVRGLFLVAPGGAAMEEAELRAFLDRFRLHTHEQALDFVDRLFAKRHPMRHLLAWGTRHKFATPGLRDLLDRIAPDDLLRPSDVSTLRMPIRLVWGAADRILHPTNLEFFRRHLPPHARVEVVEHYGHTPHMDHPHDLHHRLLAFSRYVAGIDDAPAERPNFTGVSASDAP